jgi:hypothetical protein
MTLMVTQTTIGQKNSEFLLLQQSLLKQKLGSKVLDIHLSMGNRKVHNQVCVSDFTSGCSLLGYSHPWLLREEISETAIALKHHTSEATLKDWTLYLSKKHQSYPSFWVYKNAPPYFFDSKDSLIYELNDYSLEFMKSSASEAVVENSFGTYFFSSDVTRKGGLIERLHALIKDSLPSDFMVEGLVITGHRGYKKLKENFFLTCPEGLDGFKAFIPLSVWREDLTEFLNLMKKI